MKPFFHNQSITWHGSWLVNYWIGIQRTTSSEQRHDLKSHQYAIDILEFKKKLVSIMIIKLLNWCKNLGPLMSFREGNLSCSLVWSLLTPNSALLFTWNGFWNGAESRSAHGAVMWVLPVTSTTHEWIWKINTEIQSHQKSREAEETTLKRKGFLKQTLEMKIACNLSRGLH